MMEIRVKYFEGATELEKIEKGNWIDCYAREDVYIDFLEMKKIKLGFALELPKGYEGYAVPRSSTFSKWGVIQANSFGIIDDTYIGDNDEWMFPAISLKKEGSFIKKGDKICQFRIMKSQPQFDFNIVESFGNDDRGGFGTTGTTK